MDAAEVEAIERATVEAMAPAKMLEIDGWLVPLSDSVMTRAKSAAPLRHDLGPQAISAVEAAYWTEGLDPAFRIAEAAGLRGVRDALASRGYVGASPTVVKIGDAGRLASFRDTPGEVMARPDEAWGRVFTGEGFDPEDGAGRVATLSRAPDALYGAVREDGEIVAVGVVTFGHGWAGIHGMRTAQAHRGRGYASQVLAALGRAIVARGVDKVVLQVEEGNQARSLYRKAGFKAAWTYYCWKRD